MQILVTRPKHQASQLVEELEAAGFEASCLPLLDIVPIEMTRAERADMASRLAVADKIIAVSANAAQLALPLLDRDQTAQPVFSIGPSTASVLREAGFSVQLPETSFNSEALLQLPEFEQVQGQTVAVLCGRGGRDYLEEQLAARGARVCRVELYWRRPVELDDLVIDQIDLPDVMTAMSGDTAQALAAALEGSGRQDWKALPLIVPGKRVRAIAENLGFKRIIAAEKPSTEALLKVLHSMQYPRG